MSEKPNYTIGIFGRGGQEPDREIEHIEQFFTTGHLPEALARVSNEFANLATYVLSLPRNPERTVALRKLLEAKDAAVRASIARPVPPGVYPRDFPKLGEKP